jgi:hypothetical protein
MNIACPNRPHGSYSGICRISPARTTMIGDFSSARPAPPVFFPARKWCQNRTRPAIRARPEVATVTCRFCALAINYPPTAFAALRRGNEIGSRGTHANKGVHCRSRPRRHRGPLPDRATMSSSSALSRQATPRLLRASRSRSCGLDHGRTTLDGKITCPDSSPIGTEPNPGHLGAGPDHPGRRSRAGSRRARPASRRAKPQTSPPGLTRRPPW